MLLYLQALLPEHTEMVDREPHTLRCVAMVEGEESGVSMARRSK